MADITDRADENRGPATHRTGGDEAGRIELAVEFIKYGAVPPAGERRETARLSGLPAAEAPPGVARPRSVVDGTTRGLTELAVIDDVDADLRLLSADLLDRSRQPCRVSLLVIGISGELGAVDLDERLRSRQAAHMRGENSPVASLHRVASLSS